MRPPKNEGELKSCIFSRKYREWKDLRGGAKKIKLLKHTFALQSSSHFLKSFLARYDRSIAFSYPIKMQACSVNFQYPSLKKKRFSGSQLFYCTDASANNSNSTKSDIVQNKAIFC